jgi:glycosyltransferase involved in cell wall biosynthesis
MKVTIIGTHGIPARYGGFETFAEKLATACALAGIDVRVINDKYNAPSPVPEGIKVISSSFSKSEKPLDFYRESLELASKDSDIVLCCGVGGAYYYGKRYSRNYKIITNIDGLEHLRRKYTFVQKVVVFFLQYFAANRSDYIIADSNEVWGYWTNRFPSTTSKIKVIGYGADECLPFNDDILKKYGLAKNGYLLVIARLVPENNIDEIIKAFRSYMGNKKLVITGSMENSTFCIELKKLANENVIFTGSIYNKQELDSLRQGCFIYLHGHSVGGTNPSLLEALAAGCACICHDNVFNREVTNGGQVYFMKAADLAIILNLFEQKATELEAFRKKSLDRVRQKNSWEQVCTAYINLFNKLHRTHSSKS